MTTTFALSRQLAQLRFNTRVLFVRHRVLRWTPPEPPAQAAFVPEWVRRGAPRDFTGRLAS